MILINSTPLSFRQNNRKIVSPTVDVGKLTSKVSIRLQRPTTAVPLSWAKADVLRVTVVLSVDGVLHRVTGQVSGGIRNDFKGVEQSYYELVWSPTMFMPLNPQVVATIGGQDYTRLKRCGEDGTVVQAWLELEQIAGNNFNTALTLAQTEESEGDLQLLKNSVAFDAATDAQETSGDGVLSVTHTPAGSSNLAAFFGGGQTGSTTATGTATYDGTSMTELWDAIFSFNIGHYGYRLAGIPTGAKTVTMTLSDTTAEHAVGCVTFTGVDQTTPVGTAVTTTGFADPASVTVSGTTADGMVVDNLIIINDVGLTIGANQTLRNTEDFAGTGNSFRQSTQLGSDGGVMSWSLTSADTYGLGAVEFKAAAVAAGGILYHKGMTGGFSKQDLTGNIRG